MTKVFDFSHKKEFHFCDKKWHQATLVEVLGAIIRLILCGRIKLVVNEDLLTIRATRPIPDQTNSFPYIFFGNLFYGSRILYLLKSGWLKWRSDLYEAIFSIRGNENIWGINRRLNTGWFFFTRLWWMIKFRTLLYSCNWGDVDCKFVEIFFRSARVYLRRIFFQYIFCESSIMNK